MFNVSPEASAILLRTVANNANIGHNVDGYHSDRCNENKTQINAPVNGSARHPLVGPLREFVVCSAIDRAETLRVARSPAMKNCRQLKTAIPRPPSEKYLQIQKERLALAQLSDLSSARVQLEKVARLI